jgi:uncharacterized repeat protein (TIGR02543 family)
LDGTVNLPVASKVGNTFDGWYSNSNFTGTAVKSVTAADYNDKTFFAKWTQIPGKKTTSVLAPDGVKITDFKYLFNNENLVKDSSKGITLQDSADNKSVDIRIGVTPKTIKTVDNAQELINASGKKTLVLFFDINAEKVVSKNGEQLSATTLTELPKLLQFNIALDSSLQGKDSYIVFRRHDGKIDEITSTPNSNGEYFKLSSDKKSLNMYVRKFSTYAVGYSNKEEMSGVVKTGDKSNMMLYAALLLTVSGLLGAGLYAKRKRKKSRI